MWILDRKALKVKAPEIKITFKDLKKKTRKSRLFSWIFVGWKEFLFVGIFPQKKVWRLNEACNRRNHTKRPFLPLNCLLSNKPCPTNCGTSHFYFFVSKSTLVWVLTAWWEMVIFQGFSSHRNRISNRTDLVFTQFFPLIPSEFFEFG